MTLQVSAYTIEKTEKDHAECLKAYSEARENAKTYYSRATLKKLLKEHRERSKDEQSSEATR